ncbi:phage tail length tape-measure protein [Lentilactobacillus kosonis]|uniref:Phage tail length tape-measure protein n=2 Tax=Lentilactobacillus kosonis TaxID=2810561 RepID=A0A401FPG6_9LACO|nr:phage tail length tape-measure protein [Lentilactobacillus kosonis]
MGAQNVQRLGLNFTHMMSSGKLQLGDFNMITDQLPMFGERLLEYERKAMKNSSLSMSKLRDDMSAGKVSAKDAEAVMNGLGKKYAEASENMMKTISGMQRVIAARSKALSGALIKPIMNAKNPLFGAISKWVSDPRTETEFNKVGKSMSKGLGTITEAFSKAINPKNAPHFADNMMKNIANGVTSLSKSIAKNASSIVNFFSSLASSIKIITTISVGFAKGLISGLNAILTPMVKLGDHKKDVGGFAGALKSISKQKSSLESVGRALSAAFVFSKITDFSRSLSGARKSILAFTDTEKLMSMKTLKAGLIGLGAPLKSVILQVGTLTAELLANPWTYVALAIVAVGAALVKLYKSNTKFRKFVNGIAKDAQKHLVKLLETLVIWSKSFHLQSMPWLNLYLKLLVGLPNNLKSNGATCGAKSSMLLNLLTEQSDP